jgi:hypothetical protein
MYKNIKKKIKVDDLFKQVNVVFDVGVTILYILKPRLPNILEATLLPDNLEAIVICYLEGTVT